MGNRFQSRFCSLVSYAHIHIFPSHKKQIKAIPTARAIGIYYYLPNRASIFSCHGWPLSRRIPKPPL